MSFSDAELLACHPDLLRYCRHLVMGSSLDGDDLCQETFERALKFKHLYIGGSLQGWLFIIARNHAGTLRRLRRNREAQLHDDYEVVTDGMAPLHRIDLHQTLEALKKLPPQMQEAIQYSVDGLTYEEIVAKTGVAVGTVKSRLNRARQALKKALDGTLPDNRTNHNPGLCIKSDTTALPAN